MNLTLPVVSQTPGPTWASEVNSDLSLIDEHNHTAGKGARIPTSGLSIDADLSFASHSLTNVKSVVLLNQKVPHVVVNRSLYAQAGDLWFDDGSGNSVQITSGGTVNVGGTGNIGGITGSAAVNYLPGSSAFEFINAAGTAASLNALGLNSSYLTIDSVTLDTPVGVSTYTLNLPSAVPGNTSFVTCNTAGQLAYTSQTHGVTRPMLAAVGEQISSYSYSGPVTVSGNMLLPVTLTTTGRPVFVGITSKYNAPNFTGIRLDNSSGSIYTSASFGVYISSGSPIVGFTAGTYLQNSLAGQVPASGPIIVPASSLSGIVELPAGTYTFQCVLSSLSGTGTPTFAINGSLYAYEL
jgi:hypothetical protein